MTLRTAGSVLALLAGLYACFNAVRAGLDPASFAAAFGAPATPGADLSFVYVYAARSLFMGLLALALLAAKQWRALALFAMICVTVPLADAAIAHAAGASPQRVAIHLAIGAILALTALLLWRAPQPKAV